MRIPGIKSIACAPCASLPADLEPVALAGGTPDISEITFSAIPFIGDPVCEVESSNENNGIGTRVTLTFNVERRVNYRRHAFVVTLHTGESYLIGSSDSIPKFSCKDTTAGPGTTNMSTVTIELSSFCAWVSVGDVAPISDTDGGTVTFETWREITEEEVTSIINALS